MTHPLGGRCARLAACGRSRRDDGGVTDTTGSNWSAQDALVLLCVGMTNGSLDRLIASYDAHNHDVLPENMFVDSLSALIESGLVGVDGDRFELTSAGSRVFKARSGGMFEIARSVLPLLGGIPRVTASYHLAPGRYDQAVKDYLRG